jgi:hypothetical protein
MHKYNLMIFYISCITAKVAIIVSVSIQVSSTIVKGVIKSQVARSTIINTVTSTNNKVAAEIKPSTTTATPLNNAPEISSQCKLENAGGKETVISELDVIKVGMRIKLQRMGAFMFVSGCCTLSDVILLSLSSLQVDRRSAFLYGFIYLGAALCTQISNLMQLAAIRTCIRKASFFS